MPANTKKVLQRDNENNFVSKTSNMNILISTTPHTVVKAFTCTPLGTDCTNMLNEVMGVLLYSSTEQ